MSNGKDVSMWMDEARQIAAQCWCDPETSGTEMDVTLCESVARRIAAWMDTGAQHARNEEYWRNRTADAENRIAALEAKVRGLEAIDAARTNAVQEAIDNAAIYQDQLAASRQQVERLVEALTQIKELDHTNAAINCCAYTAHNIAIEALAAVEKERT